jgi:hypothetical protein
MSDWTPEELARIGQADELDLASERRDGSLQAARRWPRPARRTTRSSESWPTLACAGASSWP